MAVFSLDLNLNCYTRSTDFKSSLYARSVLTKQLQQRRKNQSSNLLVYYFCSFYCFFYEGLLIESKMNMEVMQAIIVKMKTNK